MGAGKSTFINSMLGTSAKTGEGMLAVTCVPTPLEKNGLTLIDCPGDSDPRQDPDEWLEEVNGVISGQAHGVILVMKNTDYRAVTDTCLLMNKVETYLPGWDRDHTLFVWTHADLQQNSASHYKKWIKEFWELNKFSGKAPTENYIVWGQGPGYNVSNARKKLASIGDDEPLVARVADTKEKVEELGQELCGKLTEKGLKGAAAVFKTVIQEKKGGGGTCFPADAMLLTVHGPIKMSEVSTATQALSWTTSKKVL